MQLPDNLAALNEQLNKLPQVQIAKIFSVILVIYCMYLLAQMTWQLVPSNHTPTLTTQKSTTVNTTPNSSSFDLNSVIGLHLFGNYQQAPKKAAVEVVEEAPETKLNLKLSGVVASSESEFAAAIIENQGSQETYGIGEKINGTRASLEKVYADRVLIKQGGRMETLMLDGFDYSKQSHVINSSPERDINRALNNDAMSAGPSPADDSVDLRDNEELSAAVQRLRQEVADDPGKISDYLKISPKMEEGKIIGYQVMPGKDPAFFKASGLQPGDVALLMNGLDLSNPSESAQALSLLRDTSDIALLVDRNGELTEILFSIAQ
ncbi:type II secretion system protein GspC [Colwellia sp. MEBiC06753]